MKVIWSLLLQKIKQEKKKKHFYMCVYVCFLRTGMQIP
jgi:hypothetical protein